MVKHITINNTPYLFLILLSFMPLLNLKTISILLLLFFISSVIIYRGIIIKNIKNKGIKHLIINTLFYLFIVFSLLQSPLKSEGLDLLIRQVSFLLMPLIIIYSNPININVVKAMAIIFITSNLVVLVFFTIKLNLISDVLSSSSELLNNTYFLEINEDKYKDWHPTTIALNNLLASIILIHFCFISKEKKIKIFTFILVVVFFLFSIVLNSRIIFIIYLTLVPIYILLNLKKQRNKIGLLILLIGIFSILYKTSESYKLVRIFQNPISLYFEDDSLKSLLGTRYQIQSSSIELIEKNPWLGYGIGYEKQLLTAYCLEVKNYTNVYKPFKEFSSHNVYLSLWLTSGVFALISFIYLLLNNIRLAISYRKLLSIFIMITFTLVFLTENHFIRLNGILLFAFFNSYLYSKNIIEIEKER